MIEFHLSDFGPLYDDFKRLNFVTREKVIRSVLRDAGQVAADEMSRRAPRDEGVLAREMMTSFAGMRPDMLEGSILVGPSRTAFYGGFQELGTMFHPAQQFIAPAFNATEDAMISLMAHRLDEEIGRHLGQ